MITAPAPTSRRSNCQGFVLAFALACVVAAAAVVAVLAVGVASYLRLGGDARCLRNSLCASLDSQEAGWDKKIEVSVGPVTCAAIRAGLSFAPVEPEARMALGALRGADVGVYRFGKSADLDRGAILAEADEAMASRGWERVVGVAHGRELVAVYLQAQSQDSTSLHACVAVISRHEMVVVSARGNLEPLIELALNRPEWREQRWLPGQTSQRPSL